MTTEAVPYGPMYGQALAAVADWHLPQTRKGTSIPYVTHLLTVSALVLEDGGSETEAVAALLHDTIEDAAELTAPVSRDEIGRRFGEAVLEIVDDCSDADPSDGQQKAPWLFRKSHHIDALTAVMTTPRATSTARVVAADKLSNIRAQLVDAESMGESSWNRFKGGFGGTAWYLRQMSAVVSPQLPDSMLVRELSKCLNELETLCRIVSDRLGDEPARISKILSDSGHFDDKPGADEGPELFGLELARRNEAGLDVPDILKKWFGDDTKVGNALTGGVVYVRPSDLSDDESIQAFVDLLKSRSVNATEPSAASSEQNID